MFDSPGCCTCSEEEWFCAGCIQRSTRPIFPIQESRCLYSTSMFEEVARNRKENYFKKPSSELSLQEIESDYWAVTAASSQRRGLEVEYGNDLATDAVGSGFPAELTLGGDEFGSAWYFDQLVKHPQNILRDSHISGVTVPWLYVAQFFSTFCWHNEDGHLYAINYMHKGEPKVLLP